jgi:oxalate decarboxylase/phosphoglucose isomerase-like protein (cupin superfamily)
LEEIRNYGHDCIQHAGDLIYVPDQWAHMVVNIGDTVAIVSERGLKDFSGSSDESSEYKAAKN